MATGGDILEVSVNHPDLGSKIFFAKASEGNTFEPGGFRTEDDEDSVDSGGNMIQKINRKLGFFEIVLSNDLNEREDFDFISQLHQSSKLGDWTVSIINGVTFGGQGKPVGTVTPNINDATMSVKISGPGFKKIIG